MKTLSKILAAFMMTTIVFSCSPIFATNDNSIQNTKDLSFDKKIGISGFYDCKIDNLKIAGTFHEYHNFGWTYDSNSEKCFFKSNICDFDEFYRTLYESNILIVPCIQQGTNTKNKENKPINENEDSLNPESYKTHSNVLFNYTARYGLTKVSEDRLNITQGTQPLTGLGYITYYENWNEPDKVWLGDEAHFSAEEYAAMCSADYDGHEGKLGTNYGIKQADPYSKLVMGGLSTNCNVIEYLNDMKKWSEENRNSKTLPFDVINIHYYTGLSSPESSDFENKIFEIIKWRNENAPDKEVWLTEFGWDTNPSSLSSAPSTEQQRDWIIREYLIADQLGLDRITYYSVRDSKNQNSSQEHTTSGLTTQKAKEERKLSWYGVATLKDMLTNYKFSGIIRSDSFLKIYKYTNLNTSEDCYVLWCPSENGFEINNYELQIGDNSGANLVTLQHESLFDNFTSLQVENNTVKVNVSESPIFVKVLPDSKTISLFDSQSNSNNSEDNNDNTKYEITDVVQKNYDASISNNNQNTSKPSLLIVGIVIHILSLFYSITI